MDKSYERINWQNEPNISTPLNATNLNKIDSALDVIDDRVIEMNATLEAEGEWIESAKQAITELEEHMETAESNISTLQERANTQKQAVDELLATCDMLTNTKASCIVCNAKGAGLTISDCSALPFQAVRLQGNTQQDSTTGKNLYKGNSITASNAGAISDIEISLANGKTYTVSLNKSVATQADMYLKDADHNDITKLSFKNNGKNTLTFTPSEDVHNIGWYIAGAMSITDIQIEEGSTATAYEKFTGGIASPNPLYPQPINSAVVSEVKVQGKNLLDCRGLTEQTTNGVTYTPVYENGMLQYVEANGTATANATYVLTYLTTDDKELYLNGVTSGSISTYRIQFYDNVSSTFSVDLYEGQKLMTKNVTGQLRLLVMKGASVKKLRFYPMIRKADISDASYEPYQGNTIALSSPIELNKIGGVADEVAEGKVTKRFAEILINSLDKIINVTELNTVVRFVYSVEKKGSSANDLFCDKLQCKVDYAGDYEHCYRAGSGTQILFYINKERFSAIDNTGYLNYLSANPFTMLYELSEPVVTDLPTEDVQALDSLHGYKPVTYITTDSEVQAIIDVDYVADTKAYIDNKFNMLATALVAGSEV